MVTSRDHYHGARRRRCRESRPVSRGATSSFHVLRGRLSVARREGDREGDREGVAGRDPDRELRARLCFREPQGRFTLLG